MKTWDAPVSRVVVVTGAGISAESGVATYRAVGSGWTDPDRERMSQADRYGQHLPALWAFWGALRAATAAADPNAAHLAVAAAERTCVSRGGWLTVVTQNVDGLHQRAGSTDVVEVHGSVHRSRCLRCGCLKPFPDSTVPGPGQVPLCAVCPRPLRPDVVLFGEQLARKDTDRAYGSLRAAQVCVYVGTSGNVRPVSEMVGTARAFGATCVLVNAEPWDERHPDFHETFLGPATVTLPGVLSRLLA